MSKKKRRGGGGGMADAFITLSRSISSRLYCKFLEALLSRKAVQIPMLTGEHSESFLLEKRMCSWDGFLCCVLILHIEQYSDV